MDKDDHKFPVLVLVEREDGRVTGAAMRDPNINITSTQVASRFVEPFEVDAMIDLLKPIEPGDNFMGFTKEANIEATSLDVALRTTPETNGQKFVLLYRDAEWLQGLWNNESRDGSIVFSPDTTDKQNHTLDKAWLHSMSDLYAIPASIKKRRSRADLDVVHQHKTLTGDYALLTQCVEMLESSHVGSTCCYENHPAVVSLCCWWNKHAPEPMRKAGIFRLYIWDDEDKYFEAGDPEEPIQTANDMAKQNSYAIFKEDGKPTVSVLFLRGKAFNTPIQTGGTNTYYADGDEFFTIGLDVEDVDESYYSLQGLRTLSEII